MSEKYIPDIADGIKLPNIDSDGVDVFIFLPAGMRKKLITIIAPELLKLARKTLKTTPITRFITYFTFEDGENIGPPYEIVIRYTKKEWDKAVKKPGNPNDYPLVGYLVLKPDGWGEWQIFVAEITTIISPDVGDGVYGFIHLTITELVDPLIGDC